MVAICITFPQDRQVKADLPGSLGITSHSPRCPKRRQMARFLFAVQFEVLQLVLGVMIGVDGGVDDACGGMGARSSPAREHIVECLG